MDEILHTLLGGIRYWTDAAYRSRIQTRWRRFGLRMRIADVGLWTLGLLLIVGRMMFGLFRLLGGKTY